MTFDWLRIGNIDYTWVFFACLFGAAWLLPKSSLAERVVWLWFGAPLLLALFFTAIPNTHVYNFFIAWALLAGKVIADGWQWLTRRFPPGFLPSFPHRLAQLMAVTVAVAGIGIFGSYEYWYFVYRQLPKPKG